MNYKEKLKDRRWQQKSAKIKERDQWKCMNPRCTSNDYSQLQVHHLEYWPGVEPWDYPDEMLVSLCHVCHSNEWQRDAIEKQLYTALKTKGFLFSDLLVLSCMIHDDDFTKSLLKTLRDFQDG